MNFERIKKWSFAILNIPVSILIVIIFEIYGLTLIPSAIFKPTAIAIGLWYQIYILLTGIITVFIIYSLLRMKRTALYLYFGMYIIHNVVALIVGNWIVYVMIIPIVGAVLLIPHIKKMS